MNDAKKIVFSFKKYFLCLLFRHAQSGYQPNCVLNSDSAYLGVFNPRYAGPLLLLFLFSYLVL